MVPKLLLSLFITLSVSAVIQEEDGVWVLNDSNFEEALSQQPDLLVEFYAPWCGHCKKLAPEYSKAGQALKQHSPPIRIAKLDADANKKTASAFKVQGYPTLKYFVNKVPTEYTGGRTEDTIVSWVLKRNSPSLSVFSSLQEFLQFATSHKALALILADSGSSEASLFEGVSKSIDSVTFALLSDPEALAHFQVQKNSVVLLKQFDDLRVDYTGKLSQNEVTEFINGNRLPWVVPFGDEAIDAIFKKLAPGLFLFTDDYSKYEKDLAGLSQEFKGQLVFSYADLNVPDNNRLSEYLGVKASEQPAVVVVDPRGDLKKFKLESKPTVESIKNFAVDWKNGKLSAYFKSEPVPKQDYEGNVRVLVGKNFEEVVYDQSKDVLVEFYAPWCGHCKSLAPDYEKLGAEFRNSNIVIAKMDATANEAKGVAVKGFPTIRFYSANNKKPEDFAGDRNYDGLKKFVLEKANAKAKVEVREAEGKVEL